VAVKIIDHYSTDGAAGGDSQGNRISAGREMLFATSIAHPNLVRIARLLSACKHNAWQQCQSALHQCSLSIMLIHKFVPLSARPGRAAIATSQWELNPLSTAKDGQAVCASIGLVRH
jgi:hypothetical protein